MRCVRWDSFALVTHLLVRGDIEARLDVLEQNVADVFMRMNDEDAVLVLAVMVAETVRFVAEEVALSQLAAPKLARLVRHDVACLKQIGRP